MKLFNERVHGVLSVIELLCPNQDLGSVLLRNNDNAVLIGHNYVARPHRHTIAIHGNVNPAKR